MVNIKRVRILLRVSSEQQLETDGDLSVQRQLVADYVSGHEDWILDDKEYYEGSISGYRNALNKRDTLQEALEDAKRCEYDILAVYKDDRIGRRMWEIGAYVMTLKSYGVDIYTVRDGCISPESDDIIGQMMLALRYGNAQKSSADTGMRVKDNAQKLVEKGKFMGGSPPYGYRLVFSGEISKHGRALHKLEIVPQEAAAVQYIYHLSLHKELGSMKIAKSLNEDPYYKTLAPNGEWKSATITGILTNPVYTGRVAYKRRERKNGHYHRTDKSCWAYAQEEDMDIRIIDKETWARTQDKRERRAKQYQKGTAHQEIPAISRNDGTFLLTDVLYCGVCGRKMTNASRYSYWTLKKNGEKRSCKRRMYRCQALQSGIPHDRMPQLNAEDMEKSVLGFLAAYIEDWLKEEDISEIMKRKRETEKQEKEAARKKAQNNLEKLTRDMRVMQEHIPDAMSGNYPLSVEEIASAIRRLNEKKETLESQLKKEESLLQARNSQDTTPVPQPPWTWRQVFLRSARETQRVLINLLLAKIEVYQDRLVIRLQTPGHGMLP